MRRPHARKTKMLKLDDGRVTQGELEETVKWLNDPVFMKYSEQRHKTHSVGSQLEYIHGFRSPHQYRKITLDGKHIGSITAYIDIPNNVADVGIMIGPPYGHYGHGREAWRMFCQELAKQGVRKIEGGCMAKNTAMLRIFEKNHMRLEGTRRNHFWTADGFDHLVMYGTLT